MSVDTAAATDVESTAKKKNRPYVVYLIIKMAMRREESKGLHYTIDFPPENG